MTKKILILFLWLLPFGAFAQVAINVSGTITDQSTGAPIPNLSVNIMTDSSGFFGPYSNTVTTNASGFYTDTFGPPSSQGVVYVSVSDCNGVSVVNFSNYATIPGAIATHTINMQICGSNPGGCTAAYSYVTQGSTLTATNLSTGGSPGGGFQSIWSLFHLVPGGTSDTSYLTNPVFTINPNDPYMLCLNIIDSAAGCSDTFCDSIVNGGSGTSCDAAFTAFPAPNTVCTFQFDLIQTGGFSSLYWDFGDGSGQSGTNTIPTHQYSASGAYMVVCMLFDQTGAVCDADTTMITVNCGGPLINFVAGNVSKPTPVGNMPANAEVYLIEYDATAGTLTALDTVLTDSMGNYVFNNVSAGTYRVKAALLSGDPDYASFLPTYYGSVLLWNQSVSVNQNASNVNIGLLAGVNPGGPGFIGGLISQGANKTTDVGDPIADLTVLLTDFTDGPVAYTKTDINGQYEFPNLAYGTYKIWVDALNKTCTPLIVTISGASSAVTNADLEVNSTYITAIYSTDIQSHFEVYPNPAQNLLNINLKDDNRQEVTVQILDIMGKTQIETVINDKNNEITLAALPQGYYFLVLKSENGNFVQKILKQ
ncbi:MAG: T9SS type A sorting domain-containing protein [Bacteroidia bacterium]|nr:T9SS type A sorting domain-containing protein [Bacteroidia bacterium]